MTGGLPDFFCDELDRRNARWQSLVDLFKLTKPGVDPWDAGVLAENFAGASHGEKCTIKFLLNVWNPGGGWDCGPFDLIEAYQAWDDTHRNAFCIWANNPWWP